jgi:hypothetical protein
MHRPRTTIQTVPQNPNPGNRRGRSNVAQPISQQRRSISHPQPVDYHDGKPGPRFQRFEIGVRNVCPRFEDNDPTNTNKTRMTPAITLNQTGNAQAGYYFLSLVTGCRLARQQWTVVPMPEGTIATVERMATEQAEQAHPAVEPEELEYEWAPGNPILDELIDEIDIAQEPDIDGP